MEALLRELWQLREIQELAQLMESGGGPALVTGLSPVHRAMTAAALRLKSGRPLHPPAGAGAVQLHPSL